MTEPLPTEDFRLDFPDQPRRRIHGRVTRPADVVPDAPGAPAVIVVHGFKGFLRWGFFPVLQERLARRGIVSVALNLSGSGVGEDLESFTDDEGFFHATPSRDLEDVDRVRRAIEAGELGTIDPMRLGLFGHSRGGGTVLLHAARRGDYRAVVTWASVAATNRFSEEFLAAWRARGVYEVRNARTGKLHRCGTDWVDDVETNAAELEITAACARLRTPTLLVHGGADETVPAAEQGILARAFSEGVCERLTIEGAGHTFGAVHPWKGSTPQLEAAFDATLSFFQRHLGATASR